MITTSDDVTTWLGISAMDSLATAVQQLAENHVKDHLGWQEIEQTTFTEYYPLDTGEPYNGDPTYVVNSAHTEAVPGQWRAGHTLQLRNIPVRSVTNVWEDMTGYFGQGVNAFSAPALTSGSDYYVKMERDGICWSGNLVRRSFWFPNAPGSIKVEYVSGFTAAELSTGRWNIFKTAVLETLSDLYMRGKALSIGHMSNIASESDGGGVSVSYYKNRLGGCTVPDIVADMLSPYVFYGEDAI